MLQVFTIILYQNVSQNPEIFGTRVSLSPEQSTLKCNNGNNFSVSSESVTAYDWQVNNSSLRGHIGGHILPF
jgi:hypothetical protein